MRTYTKALVAALAAFLTLVSTSTALTVELISQGDFQERTPLETWSWGAALSFPGYFNGDYDYFLADLISLEHQTDGITLATIIDSDSMDLTPLFHDSQEIGFRTYTTLIIKESGDVTMRVDDMQSGRGIEIGGSLSGNVIRGQDIYINAYADLFPAGSTTAYIFSIKDGNGQAQTFNLKARATSAGDLSELTTLHIGGWSGSELTIGFLGGNVLQGNFDEFRIQEIDVIATVPEPGTASLALLGSIGLFVRPRRRW